MKSCIKNLLVALAMIAGLAQTAHATVTFTNTPAAVSNTYPGTISLLIAGLTNTETVVVQKFLDVNTNGIIDGSDFLVQQFILQDGTNTVIGGVPNFNVPGDLNPATGAITAILNFQNGDFVQNLVGKYLYKLSSPGGHFTPLTNSFNVTNFPFAQKFTGNVVSNSSGTTLSNAFVVLFPPPRSGDHGLGQPLAGTVANNAGAYTIMAPAGTYTLIALQSNYLANTKKAPVLTLAPSATVTTNLSLTNATAGISISGSLEDAVSNAIKLPGIFLPVQSTNDLLAICFSDTNGNFAVRVTAGQWSLGTDSSGLIVHGYVGLNNGTNVNSGSSVTLAYFKANAMFYGSVVDVLGNPMVGIDVNVSDNTSNLYSMDGYTDAVGNYAVGALGFGSADPWQLNIGGDSGPTNFDFSQAQVNQNNGTNLNIGVAVLQNFTAVLATNTITGNVKDSNGTNLVGVGVNANITINGTNYQPNTSDTDSNGNYSLNVANGASWDINLNCNGGSDSLSQLGSYACPNDQFATISGNNATNNFIVQICGGITITTTSPLPVGEVNVFYNQSIQASDCSDDYNWSQTGGSLPGNLNLGPGGPSDVLSGFPTASGTSIFTVQVDDGNGHTTNRQFSVTISNALQVTTASLPNGTNGNSYSQQLQAVNGVPFGGVPYSWSLSSGSLPANLNLATNGLISGSLMVNGVFNFTVEAADSLGATFDQPLSVNIVTTNLPPLAIGNAGGQIVVLWPASAGTNFTLQTATNLAGPWVTASNGVPQAAFIFTNTSPAAFFRLQ